MDKILVIFASVELIKIKANSFCKAFFRHTHMECETYDIHDNFYVLNSVCYNKWKIYFILHWKNKTESCIA